ncbi:MAG: group II intron reverse transcriptase/maturase, partial [Bacteroidota bacterium]
QERLFDDLQNGRTVPVSKAMVWEAFKRLKNKGRAAGIGAESMRQYEEQLKSNLYKLYKLWNRMSSGSYFPPPVRAVRIPKSGGGERKLGVAPLSDKVGQMVVKQAIEARLEAVYEANSYGYRPEKGAHKALEAVRKNAHRYGWVIDLDIKGFFDNIDHELLMKALSRHVEEKWILMYVRRWLAAPIRGEDGQLTYRTGRGTPQGGIISPILANLFLHYALDKWLCKHYPQTKFVRYADDVIIHANSEQEARGLLESIRARLNACKLSLNEEKTRIVYCKSYNREEEYPVVKFDFLGYSFQPRSMYHPKYGGGIGFSPAISQSSRSQIYERLREMRLHRRTERTLVQMASELNPKLVGWIHYYGRYKRYKLREVFWHLDARLVKWLVKKYKSLKGSRKRGRAMLRQIYKQMPTLFAHWKAGLCAVRY